MGNICLQLAPESKFRVFNNATNKSYVDVAAMEAERLHVSATLACLTAIIQVTGEGTDHRAPASEPSPFDVKAELGLDPFPLPHFTDLEKGDSPSGREDRCPRLIKLSRAKDRLRRPLFTPFPEPLSGPCPPAAPSAPSVPCMS